MRKSLLPLSIFVLSLLMIIPVFAQRSRGGGGGNQGGGDGRPSSPPQIGGGQQGGGGGAPAVPRGNPGGNQGAVPRFTPLPRNNGQVPSSQFGFFFGSRSYPYYYSPYLYNFYPYYSPYYSYPRYSPYLRYPGSYVCNQGYWGYGQNGNIIWVTGYCNVPYHRHDACFYYNCY